MHEILTVQLGHHANHIATHFWNTQKESYFTYDPSAKPSPVDHDIHFRPGTNTRGEDTYTPRTLVYDLKGGFGGLKKWGGLYDQHLSIDDGIQEQGQKTIWKGKVSLQQDLHIPQSDYQKGLEQNDPHQSNLTTETVRYWSDYNRIFYHPRSVIQLNEDDINSSLSPFEKYETGEELFQNLDREEDILDRDLRPWAEECDQMQGIQVLTGANDAWAGFASRYVERIKDEFGKKVIWVWGVSEEQGKQSRAKQASKAFNAARMMSDLSMYVSMYVPLSIPAGSLPSYVELDRGSQWHTSALLSAALETTTLPSRLRADSQKHGLLDDLTAALNVNGNQHIGQLHCSVFAPETELRLPTIIEEKDDRMRSGYNDALIEEGGTENASVELDMNLSGEGRHYSTSERHVSSNHIFGGVECFRGNYQGDDGEANGDEIAYFRKRRRFANKAVIERYYTTVSYPVLDSFPSIFSDASDSRVSVRTSLSTSSQISKRIRELRTESHRIASLDEREALSNSLSEMAEAYEEGWDGGDDDDSED
ncbi:MAG: hypothetical protein Q9164_002223 [Protoblastenia rupestris]